MLALLDAFPAAATLADRHGNLPLHLALYRRAADSVIDALLRAHPAATATPNGTSNLPLHLAVYNQCSARALKAIFEAHRDAAKARPPPRHPTRRRSLIKRPPLGHATPPPIRTHLSPCKPLLHP